MFVRVLCVVGVMAVVVSCNCGGGSVIVGGTGGGTGNGAGGSGNGSGGAGNGTGGAGGGTFFDPDSGCAAVTSQGSLGSKPVDIIMVIDNSGSMTAEIQGVQDNINANFASILTDGGLDWRVILLSKHGSAVLNQSICITAPLSGTPSCTIPPLQPTNTAKFFHYDQEIDSHNALQMVTQRFAVPDMNNFAPMGYRQWLRMEAFKIVLVITDDEANINQTQFETALFALQPQHFGTATARNYRLHAIIGLPGKPNPNDPYLPAEPLVTGTCNGGVAAGTRYQELARTTGGLRFPECFTGNYSAVFSQIAAGVVAGAKASCDFIVPAPPPGFSMFNRIIVQYTPSGGGAVQSFTKVADMSQCGPSNYYVDQNRLVLCPQVCSVVQADPTAKVDVIFTCEPEIN